MNETVRDAFEFDLDRYLHASKKLDLSDIDWGKVREYPIEAEELYCLGYMKDIESYTVVYLKELLSTPAITEQDVTDFLACWVYEELWHGKAFERFLMEAGYPLTPAEPERSRKLRAKVFMFSGRVKDFVKRTITRALGKHFIALHMTWGAINELTTLTGYQQIIAKTENPVLAEILRRIIKDERRHFAFYYNQARHRLSKSRTARIVTAVILRNLWTPVGVGARSKADFKRVFAYLIKDDYTPVAAVDETIGKLPGLDGIDLLTKYLPGPLH